MAASERGARTCTVRSGKRMYAKPTSPPSRDQPKILKPRIRTNHREKSDHLAIGPAPTLPKRPSIMDTPRFQAIGPKLRKRLGDRPEKRARAPNPLPIPRHTEHADAVSHHRTHPSKTGTPTSAPKTHRSVSATFSETMPNFLT